MMAPGGQGTRSPVHPAPGITLPDLLILVVVLALLLAVVVPEASAWRRHSLERGIRAALQQLATAEDSYFYDHRVYSADPARVARLRAAANFGFGPDRICMEQGLNAKLPEVAAAIGLATLDAFPGKKRRRMEIHRWYGEELERAGMPG